jgi:phosphoribosyl 1,2-cyclic phosphodiesterase
MHSSLAVSYRGREVMIDCGADWLSRIQKMRPSAILLTHAHPDHAWGLKDGAPCAVYATAETWSVLKDFPIFDPVCIRPRTPFQIHGMTFEAFPVEHSTRAPAAGYRITAGRTSVFYVPDLVYIREEQEALRGVAVYIGDGATLKRPMVRRRGNSLVGHAAIRTQLGWCQREGVAKALFTHCGTEITGGNARSMTAAVRDLGLERGIEASIAFDGLEVILR